MSDFESEIKSLTFLVEARVMLWDKKGDIYKDRNEIKKAWREVCIGLKEDFEALGDIYDEATKKQRSNNQITVHCRSLRIHGYLVSVLGHSTGRWES